MLRDVNDKMQKSVEHSKAQLATFRTGRANPDILSKIQVEYYGSFVPLKQVAMVSVAESAMLMLNVFDRGAVKSVEKAITSSDLNLNPMTEGNVIRLRLPELTEERRRDLVKLVKKEIEEGKVSLRNIRRDSLELLKQQEKDKEIAEDDSRKYQDEIQKSIDKFSRLLDQLGSDKEAEIMKI